MARPAKDTVKKTNRKKKKEVHVQETYIPPVQVDNSKQDAINALKSNGYEAYSEDGVIMVRIEYSGDNKEISKAYKEVEKILHDIGYNRSYGCRAKKVNDG